MSQPPASRRPRPARSPRCRSSRSWTTSTSPPSLTAIVGATPDEKTLSAKSDIVAEALRRLAAAGVDTSRPVLVGDRHHDVEGGAAHGVPVIFVRWGFSWPHESEGAQAAVDDVDQLRALLLVDEDARETADDAVGAPMPELAAAILGWLVPALVVFGVDGDRRRRHRVGGAAGAALASRPRCGRAGPRRRPARRSCGSTTRSASSTSRSALSGALYGGDAPSSLRRARLTAQHVRDDAFEEYRAISDRDRRPRRGAARRRRASTSVPARPSPPWPPRAGARRLGHRERVGRGPDRRGRAAAWPSCVRRWATRPRWSPSCRRASPRRSGAPPRGSRARGRCRRSPTPSAHLDAAAARAADPSLSALPDLAAAERALRQAEADARNLEETHRLVLQAAQAVPDEIAAARTALRQASVTREHLDAARRRAAGRRAPRHRAGAHPHRDGCRAPPDRARSTPSHACADRLDLALGDARTAQQRLRGARTALPGTLAAARGAIAQAEASVSHAHAGADARSRLLSAQRELAQARQAEDPVAALDAARRAMRDAEDAKALADYARLAPGH